MKILVTGAHGFIGKNLIKRLQNKGYDEILEYVRESTDEDLKRFCEEAGFVFHLAGVNRPADDKEFWDVNAGLTQKLMTYLEEADNRCPVIFNSSVRVEDMAAGKLYGESKLAGEEAVYSHGQKSGAPVIIYRLTNVFGKWSRPNYNSAVATFCHNIARGLPITVNDSGHMMHLAYIDDVVAELIEDMEALSAGRRVEGAGERHTTLRCPIYHAKLGYVAETIESFPRMRESLEVPQMADEFISKLYSTYLSFLPEDGFSYKLKMNKDGRGSFTEFIKTSDRGQVSVNITHPGIVKGQHWHDSKNEKFLVVKGRALIRFRKIGNDKIIDYHVSDEELEVVDIPTGYAHCIINEGDTELVTLMWASEIFNPDKPDTYREEV
ncbi:MAG: NAD-dependent epimerase/dehydratase family protein [Lachnospiraceae bacterium]|nr:NAD-dependent epimerase/dehydratase family protein [Lachnospiraceae bacterium]